MKSRQVSPHVWALHADAKTDDLFEGIWPIPHGVSLNSYLVKGEKIALIDLVRDWVGAPKELETQLGCCGVSFSDIDYMIINHMEPDHTGWLAEFRARAPKAEIIASEKAIPLVKSFYHLETGLRAVKTGDSLDLGSGQVLSFVDTPNVHWPETMVTWLASEGVLFSCDAFGSYGELGERVFDDEYSAEEHAFFEKESLRYYSNIVSSFSVFVQRAIAKLEGLDIKAIAPSHGIVWRKTPRTIVDRYARYASFMNGPAERRIAVIYGSMYGNTKKGLDAVIRGIESAGLPYSVTRLPDEDASFALAEAWRSQGIILGMPTYEYHMFPPVAHAIDLFERKHVWNKEAFRFGSYGWVGGAKKEYEEWITPLKWKSLESVEWAGGATDETLKLLEARGRELALKVKETGLE